jgi:hypothetical protein
VLAGDATELLLDEVADPHSRSALHGGLTGGRRRPTGWRLAPWRPQPRDGLASDRRGADTTDEQRKEPNDLGTQGAALASGAGRIKTSPPQRRLPDGCGSPLAIAPRGAVWRG